MSKSYADKLLDELREGIDACRKEVNLLKGGGAPSLPPPIPDKHTFEILVSRNLTGPGAFEASAIPYVCAQVGRLGRGAIGISPDGEVVFHFTPVYADAMQHIGLQAVEEMWVVLKPPPALTNPYAELEWESD
jgi:hypothetical protein